MSCVVHLPVICWHIYIWILVLFNPKLKFLYKLHVCMYVYMGFKTFFYVV